MNFRHNMALASKIELLPCGANVKRNLSESIEF